MKFLTLLLFPFAMIAATTNEVGKVVLINDAGDTLARHRNAARSARRPTRHYHARGGRHSSHGDG